MRALGWDEVVTRRLERNHLANRAPAERLVDVVGDVCGLQAQILAAAELAVAARVDDVTQTDVRAELWDRRRLVKAYTLRGTIHVHAAVDVPLYFAAARAVSWWRDAKWLRERGGVGVDQLEEVLAAAREALDGTALTQQELGSQIVKRVGRWAAQPRRDQPFGKTDTGVWTLLANAYDGPFCYGPNRGRHTTTVRADQWIEAWREVEPQDAIREVARRYLRAYGPATAANFAHWFGMDHRAGSAVFDSMADELREVDVEGFRAWQLRADERAAASPRRTGSVRLLPDYDSYTIGGHPPGPQRQRLIPRESGARVFGGGAGPFAALVVDGHVAGVWKRRAKGRRLEIRVERFTEDPIDRRAVTAEAERIGAFLGLEASVSWA